MLIVDYVALVFLLLLQIGDILTTNKVLSQGGVEKNPVEAWCIRVLGKAWWVPKVAVVTAAGAFAVLVLPTLAAIILVALCSLYVWVVLHNLGQIK